MNFYEGIEIKKDDKKCYIGNIDEFINMKYGYEREKDSMFSINVKDDDIIFDKDFIFGIVMFIVGYDIFSSLDKRYCDIKLNKKIKIIFPYFLLYQLEVSGKCMNIQLMEY